MLETIYIEIILVIAAIIGCGSAFAFELEKIKILIDAIGAFVLCMTILAMMPAPTTDLVVATTNIGTFVVNSMVLLVFYAIGDLIGSIIGLILRSIF
jgi:hypothetical protein